MAPTSLLSPGETVPEMAVPCSDGTTRWTSELLADGPVVLFVLEGVASASASDHSSHSMFSCALSQKF